MVDIRKHIIKTLEDAKKKIISNIEKEGISASGRTQNALSVVERGDSLMLIKNAGDNAPMETLEIGRKAGKVPKGFNEIILEWIRAKGLSIKQIPYKTDRPHKYSEQERSERAAAGAIAHTIIKKGTKRNKNKKKNIYSPVIIKTVAEINSVILNAIGSAIKVNK